jgi:hypothetical protein
MIKGGLFTFFNAVRLAVPIFRIEGTTGVKASVNFKPVHNPRANQSGDKPNQSQYNPNSCHDLRLPFEVA